MLEVSQAEFETLAGEILLGGHTLRFQARGYSMVPFIHDGDILEINPLIDETVQVGDIILFQCSPGILMAHRVVRIQQDNNAGLLVQGDALRTTDGYIHTDQALGKVASIEREGRQIEVNAGLNRLLSRLWIGLAPFSKITYRFFVVLRYKLRSVGG